MRNVAAAVVTKEGEMPEEGEAADVNIEKVRVLDSLKPHSAHHRRSSSSISSTSMNVLPSTIECESVRSKTHNRSKSGMYHQYSHDYEELEYVDELSRSYLLRPSTLYPVGKERNNGVNMMLLPEREALSFDINLIGAPLEVEQLVSRIKQVAEQFVYHWKSFPIVLPSPIADGEVDCTPSSVPRSGRIHPKDLFIAPSFDELDIVAVNGNGEPRKLSDKQQECLRKSGLLPKEKYGNVKRLSLEQLATIRQLGTFDVESVNFPGQHHRWRVSGLLQKGNERTRNTLLNDLALCLQFVVVIGKARIVSTFFSVAESVKSLSNGLLRIVDLLIGIPNLQVHNLDGKMNDERSKYLVAELMCKMENEESLELLCSYIRKQVKRATTEKVSITKEYCRPPVSIPYYFITPFGIELDLRLWDKHLMKKALPVLHSILERETRGWFLHFRERLILEMKAQQLDAEEITRLVNEAVMNEYLDRVYNAILNHSYLRRLGNGVTQLLIEQAQSVVLMYKALEKVQYRLENVRRDTRSHLCRSHPILSRIAPWMAERLRMTECRFRMENRWSCHEEALNLCNCAKLSQAVYFLNRDLAFMKEREPALLRELGKVKHPSKRFFWPTQIWNPSNWIVRRNFQGQSEIIPTVLSQQATTITTPRSDPSQPVYLVEKEMVSTTTTRWAFWRIFNYFHRTWSWMWNAMYFFLIYIPWCSPIGLRALFLMAPFTSDYELSQVNGMLFPRKTSATETLFTRLVQLWRHISKSRTDFETKPDTSFIGRGLTRHVNQTWNYLIKGLFGTITLLFLFPIVCIAITLLSGFVGLTAFLWMPALIAIVHLTNALVYDFDSPDNTDATIRYLPLFQTLVWNVGIMGMLQFLAASLIALVLCPTISCAIFIVAILRYCLRLLWDCLMFHLLIKNRGRIPASDSLVVKRISGPGSSGTDYYYQIRPEQALAAFEAKLELDQLNMYQSIMERNILQPQHDFVEFIEACFGSFSCQASRSGAAYQLLEKDSIEYLSLLNEQVDKRRRDLQTGLSVNIRNKIRLTNPDLKMAIQQGAIMLEKHYPTGVLSKMDAASEGQFWDNRGLASGDWIGLASLFYTELFSLDVLIPLDHTDVTFRLDPDPQIDLSRYSEMIYTAQPGGGGTGDLMGNVYASRSGVGGGGGGNNNIHINFPSLDMSAFNPRTKVVSTKKAERKLKTSSMTSTTLTTSLRTDTNMKLRTWKCSDFAEKIMIPLPIPHPIYIAVTVYNRDLDDPISIESEVCLNILKAIEDNYSIVYHKNKCANQSGQDVGKVCLGTSSSLVLLEEDEKRNTIMKNSQNTNTATRVYQWKLENWERKRKGEGINHCSAIKVDLASPEDVSLDSDNTRVIFNVYGTSV